MLLLALFFVGVFELPTYETGELVKELQWNRLIGAIPATYTAFTIDSTHYAEANFAGGTDYSGTVEATVLNNALAAMTSGGLLLLKDMFDIGTTELEVAHDGTFIGGLGWGTGIEFTGAPGGGADVYGIKVQEKDNFRASNFKILGTLADGNHGIFIYGSSKFTIDHMWLSGIGEESIFVLRYGTTWCRDGDISHNLIEGGGGQGIELNFGSQYITVANNVIRDQDAKSGLPGGPGIMLTGDATYTVEDNNINNNIIEECQIGMQLAGYVNDNTISDNEMVNNVGVGLDLYDGGGAGSPTYNSITGGLIKDNGSHGVYVRDASTNNDFSDIKIFDNTGYGVYVLDSTAIDNSFLDNKYDGNSTAAFLSAATAIKLRSIIVPFIEGSVLLAAGVNGWGWDIDLGGEYALAVAYLPLAVHQTVFIRINAVAGVADVDAMRLQIDAYGGASDEALGTETIAIVDKASTTTNFADNDYIYWLLTTSDDADIDDFTGGDMIQILVQHEAAGGADCATHAVFQTAEILYV